MKQLKILVAVRTSWHLRDFIESKLIDELKKKFEISFFFVDSNLSTERAIQEYDVTKYGEVFKYPFDYEKKTNSKNIIFRKLKTLKKIFRPKINHFLYFLNEIQNKINYQKKKIVFENYKNDGPLSAKIIKFLIKFRLDKIVQKILTTYIHLTIPKMIPRDKDFDLILIAYNSFNVYGYMDDLIRDAKKLEIKTFGLQINLDNLIDRVPLEKTDFFGVWGMQTFTWCVSHHKISPYKMALVGTPRLDILKKKDLSKKNARDYLGIENDCKLLLFCPSVREHDERFILKKIQNSINDNKFNFKIKILYKNHINKPNEFKGDYEIIREMKDEFKDIIFYSILKKNFKYKLSNLEEYAYFYEACDATISPFSTMSLEGMLKGKPALLYDYDIDTKNITRLKMNLIRHRIYHYPMRLSQGSIICNSKENITDDINKLILLTEDNNTINICKQTAHQSINFFGNKTASERIVNCIEDIYEKNELDGSREIYI